MSNLIFACCCSSSLIIFFGCTVGLRWAAPGAKGLPLDNRLAREFLKSVDSWLGWTMADGRACCGRGLGRSAYLIGAGGSTGLGCSTGFGRGAVFFSSSSSSSLSAKSFETLFGGAVVVWGGLIIGAGGWTLGGSTTAFVTCGGGSIFFGGATGSYFG